MKTWVPLVVWFFGGALLFVLLRKVLESVGVVVQHPEELMINGSLGKFATEELQSPLTAVGYAVFLFSFSCGYFLASSLPRRFNEDPRKGGISNANFVWIVVSLLCIPILSFLQLAEHAAEGELLAGTFSMLTALVCLAAPLVGYKWNKRLEATASDA